MYFFLRLLLLVIGCLPAGVLFAAQFTAEVTAWDKASLSGDFTDDMEVSFLNQSHRKGSVSKGDTAFLSVMGLPAGRVCALTVYVRSNKSSGAGALLVRVNGDEVMSFTGPFSSWPGSGGYQSSAIPFKVSGDWQVSENGEIMLVLAATANSLHLEKMEVLYEALPPSPHCLSFCWQSADGAVSSSRCESETGEGILMPDLVEQGLDRVGDWRLVGWTFTSLPSESEVSFKPDYVPVMSRFFPTRYQTFYPVYQYFAQTELPLQDSLGRDGDYAVVSKWVDEFFMMSGFVSGGFVSAVPCTVAEESEGRYRLLHDYLPAGSRYRVQWFGDSLTIFHSESGSSVGCSGARLADNGRKWEVREHEHHSLSFSCDLQGDTLARMLIFRGDLRDEEGNYMNLFAPVFLDVRKIHELLFLFDVSSLPLVPPVALWCGNPFARTDVEFLEYQNDNRFCESAVKCLMKGRVLVRRAGRYYDLLGCEVTGADR